MVTDTPEDWVLLEAAKRCEWADARTLDTLQRFYSQAPSPYRALCDMIAKHEQKPVDRKLLCAGEAARLWEHSDEEFTVDDACLRAIELYLEGYGE
jgi:hypothetical protein